MNVTDREIGSIQAEALVIMPDVNLRQARAADLPHLLALYHQLSELSTQPEESSRAVTDEHREALRRIAGDPSLRLLIAEVDGQVVGALTLYLLPNLSHGGRPFALIENVVVERDLRGGGIGRRLMARAESVASDAGCYKVMLMSNARRAPAHAFYRALGYQASHQGFTRYL